jgi:hypothetical protein
VAAHALDLSTKNKWIFAHHTARMCLLLSIDAESQESFRHQLAATFWQFLCRLTDDTLLLHLKNAIFLSLFYPKKAPSFLDPSSFP